MYDRPHQQSIKRVDRKNKNALRDLLISAGLERQELICPVIVTESKLTYPSLAPVASMTSSETIIPHIEDIVDSAGISRFILFGVPGTRNTRASEATNPHGIIQKSIRSIKSAFGDKLSIITDVCVCQYNLSGHCGIPTTDGTVDNDLSLRTLGDISLSHVEAGADVVAPSSMMDGQVSSIRLILDNNGFDNIEILSYSAKHASSLYTPFRSAAYYNEGKAEGLSIDKSSYQVSYANPRQAMREIAEDISEGADMVMIKPALWYLDLVSEAKERFDIPIVVQNVSGEYTMLKAAALEGLIDEDEWKISMVASIKRAGADGIISYFASDIAALLD